MEEKIKSILEDVLNVKLGNIADLAKYDVDSLDFISIVFKLDVALGVKISNEDISQHQLTDVNNFIKYLQTEVVKKCA